MSFTYSCDLFCDECGEWKHGDTSGKINIHTRSIWKHYKNEGWEIKTENGKRKHICPVCLGKVKSWDYYPKQQTYTN